MKKIKFRAWDKNDKKMFQHERLLNIWSLNSILKLGDSSCLILEQFTGLHDKNGVEIYEGDKVQHFEEVGMVKWYMDRFIIKWNSENCYYREDLAFWCTRRYVEVIGNIHERSKQDEENK